VLGLDPRRDRAELTQRLGVQLQRSELPEKMKIGEALALHGSFYRGPARLLAAQLIVFAAAALFVVALLVVAGGLLFGTPLPRHFGTFAVSMLLGMAALFAIGLLVAAVAPSGKAGNAIGMVLFFPSLFLGGVYIPREMMPAVLREIGDYSPLGATLKTMRDAWTGTEPRAAQLAIMAAYAVVAGLAATRLFRWE